MWDNGSTRRPNKITDNLYLGSMYESKDKEALKELGIRYILVAGNYLTQHFPEVLANINYRNLFISSFLLMMTLMNQ
jgi:hypothetical protein